MKQVSAFNTEMRTRPFKKCADVYAYHVCTPRNEPKSCGEDASKLDGARSPAQLAPHQLNTTGGAKGDTR